MKTIFFILIFCTVTLFGKNETQAYAIGIFHKNGNGENIQHKRKTTYDYNGNIYSKVVVLSTNSKIIPTIYIGKSRGHFIKSQAIFNSKKRHIAYEITYKHYNVTKGYFEVFINNSLKDSKVFVK